MRVRILLCSESWRRESIKAPAGCRIIDLPIKAGQPRVSTLVQLGFEELELFSPFERAKVSLVFYWPQRFHHFAVCLACPGLSMWVKDWRCLSWGVGGMLVLCYPVGAYGLGGGGKKEKNRQRKCRHCSFAFAHTPCLNLMNVIQQVPFVHVCMCAVRDCDCVTVTAHLFVHMQPPPQTIYAGKC